MSYPRDIEPIHNELHTIEIDDGTNFLQTKTLNIVIRKDFNGSLVGLIELLFVWIYTSYNSFQLMKLKDENTFLFNYSTVINGNNFVFMKKEQSLDIDFDEFEKHLLEMLLLNLNKEM